MKTLKVTLTLVEEMLGTASNDPNVHAEYIASKAPDALSTAEEVAAIGVEEVISKGKTVFHKENDKPFIFDYMVKGFFKAACSALNRVDGYHSKELKAYKKIIDGLVFPGPRKIMLNMPEGSTIGNCQRPLRAATAQGERIALANSETVPANTTMNIDIVMVDDKLEKYVKEWLDYGMLKGLGQWRNSGMGRFSWSERK
uniref:Uncharacterized protein n=1 Tax=viral metagenome TaxID=1070528 RepID=A0A6M3K0K9_9ZZZZ